MDDLNSVLIEGKIHENIKRKTVHGKEGCTFSIVSKQKDEKSFFYILATGKLAEIVLIKGHDRRGIRVVGRLHQNWWEDEDRELQCEIVIIAEHIEFRPDLDQQLQLPIC
jgi:single-strand DNA-binding protein